MYGTVPIITTNIEDLKKQIDVYAEIFKDIGAVVEQVFPTWFKEDLKPAGSLHLSNLSIKKRTGKLAAAWKRSTYSVSRRSKRSRTYLISVGVPYANIQDLGTKGANPAGRHSWINMKKKFMIIPTDDAKDSHGRLKKKAKDYKKGELFSFKFRSTPYRSKNAILTGYALASRDHASGDIKLMFLFASRVFLPPRKWFDRAVKQSSTGYAKLLAKRIIKIYEMST